LSRIRWIWRHLPPHGVLLFFDVKPIAVKAYGGRRYSSARRLVIERRQKTRGFFYLFLLYEVNSGWVRWAFAESKDAKQVCRFMTQVRRWYPKQGGLDRSGPRPAASAQVAADPAGHAGAETALDQLAQSQPR